jgi:hypothetical protein
MVALPLSETIRILRHPRVRELHSYMNLAPLGDLRDPSMPAPEASDSNGRLSQRFVMEAVVRRGTEVCRLAASGRDIYTITAPLVVTAMERIMEERCRTPGVTTAGAAFAAQDFLSTLAPAHPQLS